MRWIGGGIGECAGLDIECAAAGECSPLFLCLRQKKSAVNCCFCSYNFKKNQELLDLKNQKIRDILEKLDKKISDDSGYRQQLESVIADARKRKSLYLTTVADLMAAISRNRVGFGHGDEYWVRDEYTRFNEAVAQMFVLYGRQAKEWKMITLLIPELAQGFRELISKSLGYMI